MCGIVGMVERGGGPDTIDVLLEGLSNLEYRGYDSAGVAVANGTIEVCKCQGELDALKDTIDRESFAGQVGIGHTRWSTHGPPSNRNAHPHTDGQNRVAVVHNGIIDNYAALREELTAAGYEFESETDTEVVPNLIARELDDGADHEAAFRAAIDRLEGSYAIAAVFAGAEEVYAARNDSPLVLGVGEDAYYLASDVPAFLDHTSDVVYLEDDQFAVLAPEAWRVTDAEGRSVDPGVATVDWDPEETAKSGYEHFMLKEIHEQPHAIRQCLSGRVDELRGAIELDALGAVEPPDRIQFVACGTSYHAALYATELFREAGIPAKAYLGSEYATSVPPAEPGTLVIGVTQSGETADTLAALREARSRGRPTLAVTNVVASTAARECDEAVYVRAGPEIGVAATKTFASQQVALAMLATALASDSPAAPAADREFLEALRDLPADIQAVLDHSEAPSVAERYLEGDAYFFVGRGYDYPVALEGALKFKEITYEHAEGFAAGELKHGPLALVTDNTPVFGIVTGTGDRATKTVANVKEVQARDAPVIAVTDGRSDVENYADQVLSIPETHPKLAPILANVQLQLVSYHTAAALGRSIDKPRNLAKSVTVE